METAKISEPVMLGLKMTKANSGQIEHISKAMSCVSITAVRNAMESLLLNKK